MVFALGFPSGTYQVKLDLETPQTPVNAFIDVFENGVPIKSTGPTIFLNGANRSHTDTFTVPTGGGSPPDSTYQFIDAVEAIDAITGTASPGTGN